MSEALRKAAEQAIDTLGYYASVCGEDDQDTPAKQAQAALRAALAEPEQSEPDDMPSGSNCKWPTCQTEEYQQMLCKEIAQSLGLDEQSEPYVYYDPDTGETWTVGAIEDGCRPADGLIALYTTPPRRESEQSEPVAWMWNFDDGQGAAFCSQEPTHSIRDGVNFVPLYTAPPAQTPDEAVEWAVERWNAEVKNRPPVNKNRRTLDDTWRQVIRHFGGEPDALLGPAHDDLLSAAPPAQTPVEKS